MEIGKRELIRRLKSAHRALESVVAQLTTAKAMMLGERSEVEVKFSVKKLRAVDFTRLEIEKSGRMR